MRQREAEYIQIISGQRRGLVSSIIRLLLQILTLPYAAAMVVRTLAYRMGIKGRFRADLPVICIGNLTAGGTGKTPMVALVVQKLRKLGRNPGVLSRGYKGDELGSAGNSNDEGLWLRQKFDHLPCVETSDRVVGARRLKEEGADIVVMDDGFSHLRLMRDLDVVLLDATNPFGYGHLIPRGLMREPKRALRRAGLLVVTRSDQVEKPTLSALITELGRLSSAPVLVASHQPTSLSGVDGEPRPMDWLKGRKVFALCGIANPRSFRTTLESLGAKVVGERTESDHFPYGPSWVSDAIPKLRMDAEEVGAEALIVTSKDAVKLKQRDLAGLGGLPVLELAVEMVLVEGEADLNAELRKIVHGR